MVTWVAAMTYGLPTLYLALLCCSLYHAYCFEFDYLQNCYRATIIGQLAGSSFENNLPYLCIRCLGVGEAAVGIHVKRSFVGSVLSLYVTCDNGLGSKVSSHAFLY